jgi:outer membrane protein OmpA-like peptidoglycan-associated protein
LIKSEKQIKLAEGYSKSQPIAGNDTDAGRAQNRGVEVAIWANEKLKKVAKEKTS